MKIILAFALLFSLALADTCGGNCPSNKCTHCFCGNTKSMQDISSWCSKYSWNQACCKCMVSTLSGANSNAMNKQPNGSFDVGLWQVNNIHWGVCNDGKAPCDPAKNLNCAVLVYKQNGNSWKEWAEASKKCGCA